MWESDGLVSNLELQHVQRVQRLRCEHSIPTSGDRFDARLCLQCQELDRQPHKTSNEPSCAPWDPIRQNFVFKIRLYPRLITNPRISRTLSCPADATFRDFGRALAIAFDWRSMNNLDFEVWDHPNDPLGSTQHRTEQSVRPGFQPLFTITEYNQADATGGRSYDTRNSSNLRLFEIFDNEEYKHNRITFIYGLSREWEHTIECTGREQHTSHFVCVGGEGHACAENDTEYEGVTAWKNILEAFQKGEPDTDDENLDDEDLADDLELKRWYRTKAPNGDPQGLMGRRPHEWDQVRINEILNELDIYQSQESSTTANTTRNILLVSLNNNPLFEEMYAGALSRLRSLASVKQVTYIATATQEIPEDAWNAPAPREYAAIIITDPGFLDPHASVAKTDLERRLENYLLGGGTVILAFGTSSPAFPWDVNFFISKMSKWEYYWEPGFTRRGEFSLNDEFSFRDRINDEVKQSYHMRAIHLRHVDAEHMVYRAEDPEQSPVVFAKIGEGFLGWIGDVKMEEGSIEVLLAMCGLRTLMRPANDQLNGNGLSNGNGMSNGTGMPNGHGTPNGNGMSNGNEVSNGDGAFDEDEALDEDEAFDEWGI